MAASSPAEYVWTEDEEENQEASTKVFLGKIPIMLQSEYCILSQYTHENLAEVGECSLDAVSFSTFFMRKISLLSTLNLSLVL